MILKIIMLLPQLLLMIMLTACVGGHGTHTLTIQVRDQVTGDPVPFANINVYGTTHDGTPPPRGAIAATNTHGVAVIPVTDGHHTYFEVYASEHFMRPLHFEDAVHSGYRQGWRECGVSMIDGRKIQMRIVPEHEAMALRQLPEPSLPEHLKPTVIVFKPTPIDPITQTDLPENTTPPALTPAQSPSQEARPEKTIKQRPTTPTPTKPIQTTVDPVQTSSLPVAQPEFITPRPYRSPGRPQFHDQPHRVLAPASNKTVQSVDWTSN